MILGKMSYAKKMDCRVIWHEGALRALARR
jgi:hypothetical protein